MSPDLAPHPWESLRARWSNQQRGHRLVLDVVRHGETTNNALGLISGRLDVELTPAGEADARRLGASLRSTLGAAYSSTLSRSRRTLDLALVARGLLCPRFADARLDERFLGDLEGTPALSIEQQAHGDLDLCPPGGGECYRALTARLLDFLLDLRARAAVEGWRAVLICGHLGPMRVLSAILDETADPALMMAHRFANLEILSREIEAIPWPRFLGENPSHE